MGFYRVSGGPIGLCPGDSATAGNGAGGKFVRPDPSTCAERATGSGSAAKGR